MGSKTKYCLWFKHFYSQNIPIDLKGLKVKYNLHYGETVLGRHTAEAFYSTSKYLDDILNTDNPYFEGMVNQIYPPELQLNKANASDTESPFGFTSIRF